MKYAALNDQNYILRLELGDDVHESIQRFCANEGITNASLEGIGSVDSPTLAHYSIKSKKFTDKSFSGVFELTSLLGNVALVDGRPSAHVHVTISDENMQVFGGHLVKGRCSATLEIAIKSFPSTHQKVQNDQIGLKVWDF